MSNNEENNQDKRDLDLINRERLIEVLANCLYQCIESRWKIESKKEKNYIC